MTDQPNHRRSFLRHALGAGAGLLAAACTPAPPPQPPTPPAPQPPAPQPLAAAPPPLPDGLNPAHFILHNQVPLALETRPGALGLGVITPISRFFVRNNLPMPSPSILDDPDAWTLQVEGVQRPRAITLAELKTLGLDSVTTVLQCSGNGRSYYQHGPSGSPWGTGAAGCAIWTGVWLKALVEALGGPVPEAAFLTSTGADPVPDGVNPLDVMVERSIPLEKATQDCLLAWEMNGQPIPLTHGGPLRLVVPGYYGCNQIKYVRKIAFTKTQTQAKIQSTGYRMRPIGEKGAPTQPSLWQMGLKSWLLGPGADGAPVLQGRVQLYGVAFSGGAQPLAKVEVSLDGGERWEEARWVGPDLGPYAWRNFAFEATLTPGAWAIASRVIDAAGAVQDEHRVENERGYGHNGWRDMRLALTVVDKLPPKTPRAPAPSQRAQAAPAAPVQLSEAGQRGRALFTADAEPPCGVCHTLADAGTQGVVGPNLNQLAPDAARVTQALQNGVGTMPAYKDRLTPQQLSDLAAYVTEATRK
jgi:DMSO/TMAO reductase YedYZ molybdopterin-dependent catalytic subunit/mono/diheme cytochrome c family protein